jgi:hypothetical protein
MAEVPSGERRLPRRGGRDFVVTKLPLRRRPAVFFETCQCYCSVSGPETTQQQNPQSISRRHGAPRHAPNLLGWRPNGQGFSPAAPRLEAAGWHFLRISPIDLRSGLDELAIANPDETA